MLLCDLCQLNIYLCFGLLVRKKQAIWRLGNYNVHTSKFCKTFWDISQIKWLIEKLIGRIIIHEDNQKLQPFSWQGLMAAICTTNSLWPLYATQLWTLCYFISQKWSESLANTNIAQRALDCSAKMGLEREIEMERESDWELESTRERKKMCVCCCQRTSVHH